MEKYQEERGCQSPSLFFPPVMNYLWTTPEKSKALMLITKKNMLDEKNKVDGRI